jgi:hypothetical protein
VRPYIKTKPNQKNKNHPNRKDWGSTERTGDMDQVAECISNMCKATGSIPSTENKNKTKNKPKTSAFN